MMYVCVGVNLVQNLPSPCDKSACESAVAVAVVIGGQIVMWRFL